MYALGCYIGRGQDNIDSINLECVKAKYNLKGVNIESVLNSYEQYLIEEGYLGESKNSRYSFYFERMVKENSFIGKVPDTVFKEVTKVQIGKHIDNTCLEGMEEIDNQSSILMRKILLWKDWYAEPRETINAPKELGNFLLETFSEEELQSPFMRANLLLMIAWVTDLNNAYLGDLLPPIKG
ncbi:hypothetical protein LV716_08360 [Flagellimonas sp. HMM57]|uniref:hypothetical protein n=1 Tax=unclassified Flagellimonas TaxID=2644544 RepID=UPI0013D2D6FC|nr:MULTISPECIES: hypothetical protein [unclassified Flagellimonas]UII77767.1 hypothetical protein LV716_08360 [Flagellimonas sp. HMM57]